MRLLRPADSARDDQVELVAVSAWSLVHGLSALWISGRLGERIGEHDPERLAGNVSRLFVDLILRNQRAMGIESSSD